MSKKKFEKYIGTETDFQKTCARYLDSIGAVWTHVANERKTSIKRSRSGNFYSPDGNKLKQMGVKKGIQDILIFDPRCGHHGLAIELKVGYNKQSDEQFMWELNLRQCGWKTLCTNSLDEFIFVVDEYFGLK